MGVDTRIRGKRVSVKREVERRKNSSRVEDEKDKK